MDILIQLSVLKIANIHVIQTKDAGSAKVLPLGIATTLSANQVVTKVVDVSWVCACQAPKLLEEAAVLAGNVAVLDHLNPKMRLQSLKHAMINSANH